MKIPSANQEYSGVRIATHAFSSSKSRNTRWQGEVVHAVRQVGENTYTLCCTGQLVNLLTSPIGSGVWDISNAAAVVNSQFGCLRCKKGIAEHRIEWVKP